MPEDRAQALMPCNFRGPAQDQAESSTVTTGLSRVLGAGGPDGMGMGRGQDRDRGGVGRSLPPGSPRLPRPCLFRVRPTAAGPSGAVGRAAGSPRPSAAHAPGAAAHLRPREPPRRLCGLGPRLGGGRRELGRAGFPAARRRPRGPRPPRVPSRHSHFGGGGGGGGGERGSAERRRGT